MEQEENGKQNAENQEHVMSPEEQKQFNRELIEKEKGKILNEQEMKEELPQLMQWLNGNFPNIIRNKILIFKEEEGSKQVYHMYFWTSENRYSIIFVFKENGDTYMGGFVSSRKERPGEFHNRGADLSDGNYNMETFGRIINSVIERELQPLDAYYL